MLESAGGMAALLRGGVATATDTTPAAECAGAITTIRLEET
jgi:hypothetical protein